MKKAKTLLKRLFCKHDYSPTPGLMGFFCKVQCCKCGKIDNDFSKAKVVTFGPFTTCLGEVDK